MSKSVELQSETKVLKYFEWVSKNANKKDCVSVNLFHGHSCCITMQTEQISLSELNTFVADCT